MIVEKRSIPVVEFTFLGFTFRGRNAITKKGKIFRSFLPAISKKAKKKAGEKIKEMNIRNKIHFCLREMQNFVNEYVRGMMGYYRNFYKSETYKILDRIDWLIVKWVEKKYRKTTKEAWKWLRNIYKGDKEFFEHWKYLKPDYAMGLKQ